MSRTRPSRAAARTLRLLLLASLVMLVPLAVAPSHAWTPPPAPLPIEPGDTDGMDDDDHELSRPGEAERHADLATSTSRHAEPRLVGESSSELHFAVMRLFQVMMRVWN
ncbi:MAG: hypothetical protein IT349_18885 [Candidatus Eisenbacteria bacterium]|nr:hypothetical protein [Candidatus Eisenbacteria bacterium]